MVNVKEIEKLLNHHFTINGDHHIDPESGEVSVEGHVRLNQTVVVKKLPVHFAQVYGDFDCANNLLLSLTGSPQLVHGDCNFELNMLRSLEGAPDHVGGNFLCNGNMLHSLTHAPRHVGGEFICSQNHLTDLQGLPDHVGDVFYATYNADMPLLRLIQHARVEIWQAPAPVSEILEKYAGKGKAFMLNCALELKKAGYEGNARW